VLIKTHKILFKDKNTLFTVRVVKPCTGCPEVVESPSVEILKTSLGMSFSSLL